MDDNPLDEAASLDLNATLPLPIHSLDTTALHINGRRSFSRSTSPIPSRIDTALAQSSLDSSKTEPSSQSATPIAPKRPSEGTFYQGLNVNVNEPVGSMSIRPSGRDVVLAARKGLFIIDLESPYDQPRFLHHLTKWEVADVQWNPHALRDAWIASTSNQKLLIWNLNRTGLHAIEYILHAHSRSISDINWSPKHPELLVTCSVDTFVHLWDLRIAERSVATMNRNSSNVYNMGMGVVKNHLAEPIMSFGAWTAGGTQVKFNRGNEYLLASSHDRCLNIWDLRKGSQPVTVINAHTTKIYGIDWSRMNEHEIVTCSLDKLVKIWDINNPEECQTVIKTNSPVWRARYTPFGDGVLTMPQRSEFTLFMWNRENTSTHAWEFKGHTDTVKEFVWREKGGSRMEDVDDREFQLITWGKDRVLRLWPITEQMLRKMGHSRRPPRPYRRVPGTGGLIQSPNLHSFQNVQNNGSLAPTTPAISTLKVLAGNRLASMSPLRSSAPGPSTYAGQFPDMGLAGNSMIWMQRVKTIKPDRGSGGEPEGPTNLAEEFTAVDQKFIDVKFEKANIASRTCTFSLNGPWSDLGEAFVRVTATFPTDYPKSAPVFDIQKSNMISATTFDNIQQALYQLTAQYTSQHRFCLEVCVLYLLTGSAEEADADEDGSADAADDSDDDFLGMDLSNTAGGIIPNRGTRNPREDRKVPFPRMCGAVFSGSGKLVCFYASLRVRDVNHLSQKASSPTLTRRHSRHFHSSYGEYVHPKTFYQFDEYIAVANYSRPSEVLEDEGVVEDEVVDDSYFRPGDILRADNSKIPLTAKPRRGFRCPVIIKDFSSWMTFDPRLGREYIIYDDDPAHICRYNADIAAKYNRPDLQKVWLLARQILLPCVPIELASTTEPSNQLAKQVASLTQNTRKRRDSGTGQGIYLSESLGIISGMVRVEWNLHPLGRNLADDLFQHFTRIGDVQMMAMLLCVFCEPFSPEKPSNTTFSPPVKYDSDPDTTPVMSNSEYFGSPISNHMDRRSNATTPAIWTSPVLPPPSRTFPIFANPIQIPSRLSESYPESGFYWSSGIGGVAQASDPSSDPLSSRSIGQIAPWQSNLGIGYNRTSTAIADAISKFSAGALFEMSPVSNLPLNVNPNWKHHQSQPQPQPHQPKLHQPQPQSPINVKQRTSVPSLRLMRQSSFGSTHTMSSGLTSNRSYLSEPVTPRRPIPSAGLRTPQNRKQNDSSTNKPKVYCQTMNIDSFDDEKIYLPHSPLLDSSIYSRERYDIARLLYADLLYRWGLLEQRAEILKFVEIGQISGSFGGMNDSIRGIAADSRYLSQGDSDEDMALNSDYWIFSSKTHETVDETTNANTVKYDLADPEESLEVCLIDTICKKCNPDSLAPHKQCSCGKLPSIQCGICNLSARKLVCFCVACGHGGHIKHMREWFTIQREVECPHGCGCKCLIEFDIEPQTS